MAELVTLLEQHLDGEPPTVATQAITWWGTVLALAKLQEGGLGEPQPVNVCCYSILSMKVCLHDLSLLQQLWTVVL